MSKVKTVLLTVVCMVILTVLSCRALIEEFIPIAGGINERAVVYAKVDPNSFGIIESLADAKRVRVEIIINHRDMQLGLKRASEDDNLAHGDAYGFVNSDIGKGEATLDLIIGDENSPISIMGILAALTVGTGGVAIGRKYLKRPGDYTPQEHEVEVLKAKNGTA